MKMPTMPKRDKHKTQEFIWFLYPVIVVFDTSVDWLREACTGSLFTSINNLYTELHAVLQSEAFSKYTSIHPMALQLKLGLVLLLWGFLIHRVKTRCRTPLDQWSARRRDLYLHRTTQHINTTDKHLYPEWYSNPRSQQPSGRRPTP
jgi:hypothetical protein